MNHISGYYKWLGMLCCGVLLGSAVCSLARSDKYFRIDSDANVYVAPYSSDIEMVAILPFKAPTELVGASVSDLFVTDMLRAGRYTLVERSQMARVLSESELALSGLSDSQAVEVGQMLGADGVIIGTVSEYGTIAYRGHSYPVVGISCRLIECDTGQIVWSVDLAKRAESKKTTLSGHARKVVQEMSAGLVQKWGKQRTRAPEKKASRERSSIRDRGDAYEPVGMTSGLPPMPPQGFSVSDFELRQVTLTWDAPPDHPSKYQVERGLAPEGPFEAIDRVSPGKRRFTDTGTRSEPLQDSTAYYYRIIPFSDEGVEGDPSDVLESFTAPPPDPPPSITLDPVSSRAVELTWEPPASEGVVEYRVERTLASETDAWELLVTTRRTQFKDGGTPDTSLADSTAYLYRITCENRVGSVGSPSKPVEVTTQPPPAVVQAFSAEDRQVRCVPLSWAPSEEFDVIKYLIYRGEAEDGEFEFLTEIKGRQRTAYLDGGRDPGDLDDHTTYYYLINSVNNVGAESPDSSTISATTRDRPPVVQAVEVESDHAREVPIHWEASEDEKVVGYAVYRAGADDAEFVEIGEVSGMDTTEYLDQGDRRRGFSFGSERPPGTLDDHATYQYIVRAFNTADVHSDESEIVEATTKKRPDTPTGLETTFAVPKAIELKWDANPEADIEQYVLEESSGGTDRFRTLATATPDSQLAVADEGLHDGEAKRYRIKAIDEDGLESDWSDPVEGQAKVLPDPPAALGVDYGTGAVMLKWDSPAQEDVVAYNVYRKSFFSAELMATVEGTEYELDVEDIGKEADVYVTSVDADELESDASDILRVDGRRAEAPLPE